ncbi:MAG TPA: hypothetical protein VK763_13910 [Terriglobales bacterium]|nr:hypothetical protein [Terriglobales bacterium]
MTLGWKDRHPSQRPLLSSGFRRVHLLITSVVASDEPVPIRFRTPAAYAEVAGSTRLGVELAQMQAIAKGRVTGLAHGGIFREG